MGLLLILFSPPPPPIPVRSSCQSTAVASPREVVSSAGSPIVQTGHVPLDDDISPCAGDYRLDLFLFSLGHSKLVKGLLEIVEKGLLLGRSDHQMLVQILHGTAGVLLRPTSSPANHFRDEVLEARRGNTVMGLVYPRVRIQARIDHYSIDEVIDHGGDAVDTAEPLVKAGRILSSHWHLLDVDSLSVFRWRHASPYDLKGSFLLPRNWRSDLRMALSRRVNMGSDAFPLSVMVRITDSDRTSREVSSGPMTEVGPACPSRLLCSRMAHLGEEELGLAVRHQGYPHFRCRYPHHG